MYDGLGLWHGDFYQSPSYVEILDELPEDHGPYPPLLLEIYRQYYKLVFIGEKFRQNNGATGNGHFDEFSLEFS